MFLHQSEIIEYKATDIVPQPIKLFVLTTKKITKKERKENGLKNKQPPLLLNTIFLLTSTRFLTDTHIFLWYFKNGLHLKISLNVYFIDTDVSFTQADFEENYK